jgi:hypothetical protein
MSACDVLKQGLIWHVRDGRDVKIWGDRLLPMPIYFSVQSPKRFFTEDAR